MTYRVIAHHYVRDRRITRDIEAASSAAVLLQVSDELDQFGFYVVSIKPV
jgi:hypothetical protein